MPDLANERSPLLSQPSQQEPENVEFSKEDPDNPQQWSHKRKMLNIFLIALMAILSPLASSMFTPGVGDIADDLKIEKTSLVAATTAFVVCLGIGPLVLAPLSETFGRRKLYLIGFGIFAVCQIPTALSPNIATLVTFRAIAGFTGSVAIANGGGTISDMFESKERAGIFGWYLLGPLLGPTLGPLLGGIVVQYTNWRWMFWILFILSTVNVALAYFFLLETYAPVILEARCKERSAKDGKQYTFEGRDTRPLATKLRQSLVRPIKILCTQPMVFTMSLYQAIIFASMYSLYTTMQTIFGEGPYSLNSLQVGLLYLSPGAGFLAAVWFIVPKIDTIYNKLTERNNGTSKPEFRLPLANIGSVLLPLSLFAYAWTVEYKVHFIIPILILFPFGLGQVCIFNTSQNYYIDCFPTHAASAIAAGALFRSLVGGIVPLFAPALFQKVGYGWGWSVYGFAMLAVAPSPLLFQRFGGTIREKYSMKL